MLHVFFFFFLLLSFSIEFQMDCCALSSSCGLDSGIFPDPYYPACRPEVLWSGYEKKKQKNRTVSSPPSLVTGNGADSVFASSRNFPYVSRFLSPSRVLLFFLSLFFLLRTQEGRETLTGQESLWLVPRRPASCRADKAGVHSKHRGRVAPQLLVCLYLYVRTVAAERGNLISFVHSIIIKSGT